MDIHNRDISNYHSQALDAANPRLTNSYVHPAPAMGSNEDPEGNLALQNRLTLETVDKDEAKIELRHIKKIVDQHRKTLEFLSDDRGNEQTWIRIDECFHQLEQELNMEKRDRTQLMLLDYRLDETSPRRTYEVLRSSLTDSQKRVESLNADMKQQQDANCELVRSLCSVKDTNKRLLDQIHTHTKTIAALTQQRVQDEHKLDEMQKNHRTEETLWRQDLSRRLNQRKAALEDQYKHAEHAHREKLNHVKTRAGILLDELAKIKEVHKMILSDHLKSKDEMTIKLETVSNELQTLMQRQGEKHVQTRTQLQNVVQELDDKLISEKTNRVHEVAQWKQQHASILAQKEDATEILGRQVTQKTAQVHCLERTVKAEIAQNKEKTEKMQKAVDKQLSEKDMIEHQLDEANRELIHLETDSRALENDNGLKEEALRKSRKSMRESEDAINAAINGNEHLRQQLEEQKEKFLETNERELKTCRKEAEERLARLQETHQKEEAIGNAQIKMLTEQVSSKQAEVDRKKAQAESIAQENLALERDLQMWKNMFEQCNSNRQQQEEALAELRQDWTKQKLAIQETTDITESKRQTADSDLEIMTTQFLEFKRQSAARETEVTSRINALEDNLKQLKITLEDSKIQMNDTLNNYRQVKQDGATTAAKQQEAIFKLERELDGLEQEWTQEKGRLDGLLAAERKNSAEHRERFEKWRETHQSALRQVQDDAQMRLQNFERERLRVQESYRQELDSAKNDFGGQQQKITNLKEQIARTSKSYHDTHVSLQAIKAEAERNDRNIGLMKQQHIDEIRSVQSAVDSARKAEQSLQRQYETSVVRFEKEKQQLVKIQDTEKEKHRDLERRSTDQNTEALSRAHDRIAEQRRTYDHQLAVQRAEVDRFQVQNYVLENQLNHADAMNFSGILPPSYIPGRQSPTLRPSYTERERKLSPMRSQNPKDPRALSPTLSPTLRSALHPMTSTTKYLGKMTTNPRG